MTAPRVPAMGMDPELKKKLLFTPASRGQHGSRALWSKWYDNDVYWAAVNGFLEKYVPPAPPAE